MSKTSTIQTAITLALSEHELIPDGIAVIERKERNLLSDIEANLAKLGICLFVLPPVVRRVTPEADCIFVERGEIRVRVLESSNMNTSGVDAYELVESVMLALNNTNPGNELAVPMFLAENPLEVVQDPVLSVFDVIFIAQYQLN